LKLISLAESAIKVIYRIKKKINIPTALNQLNGAHHLTRQSVQSEWSYYYQIMTLFKKG